MAFDNRDLTGTLNRAGFLTTVDQLDMAKSELGMAYILARSTAGITVTGSVADVSASTVTLPGGCMGPSGVLRITSLWSFTNNGNAKTIRVKLGGGWVQSTTVSSKAFFRSTTLVMARGEDGQIWPDKYGLVSYTEGQDAAPMSNNVANLRIDQPLDFSVQLAVSTDAATLEAYLIEVFPS